MPILRRSLNTDRALMTPRPRLRGRSHLAAAVVMPALTLWWVLSVPTGVPRVAIAAFMGAMTVMLTISATLHLRVWTPEWYERLFRADHSGIHLAIGGTGVALALLGLTGWPRTVLLVLAIGGPTLGILVEWLPFPPPRGFNVALYLSLGWTPVLLLPWVYMQTGLRVTGLLIGGGVLYTIGAIVVAARKPDPSPAWFGYHEIFHLFVLAAIVVHALMLGVLVGRS